MTKDMKAREDLWQNLVHGIDTQIMKPVVFIPGPEHIVLMSPNKQQNPPNHCLAFIVDWTGDDRDASEGRLGDDLVVLGPFMPYGTIYVEDVPRDDSRRPNSWSAFKPEDVD